MERMKTKNSPRRTLANAVTLLGLMLGMSSAFAERPNIIWIVVEDMSSHFGYQGEPLVTTPNVDRLASEGIVFENAYVTAPVCSACRSAMITGMYQTTIGAHHHRSSRGEVKHTLPSGIETIPEMFRRAGYYVCNAAFSGRAPKRFDRPGKEDYNFVFDRKALYDGADWSKRKPNQPFFAQIQLRGGKLRNVAKWSANVSADLKKPVDPSDVKLPPYYPDHPALRADWAAYLDSVSYTDYEVGLIIERLRRDEVLENTVIFFLTDHGVSHARGKQFLYDEGARVPFVVWSGKRANRVSGKQRRTDPIVHIDMAATSLELAGIERPAHLEGRPLFGPKATPRTFVALARDRCDETVDRIRGIREGQFKYIKNGFPMRPYLQPCAYKDQKPFMGPLRELFADGKLTVAQALHLAPTRPEEELYDLSSDPFEIHNLAGDPKHRDRLRALRARLANWQIESGDRGRFPEPEAMYSSDMAVYIDGQKKRKRHENAARIEANIALMKKWATEGK